MTTLDQPDQPDHLDHLDPIEADHPHHQHHQCECVLCRTPLHAGEPTRALIIKPLTGADILKWKRGADVSTQGALAHLPGHCPGPVTLHCTCCGYEQTYPDTTTAFAQGWDDPDHMASWPMSCPLCPGMAALGLLDHSAAHARWEHQGRPDHFDPSDLT